MTQTTLTQDQIKEKTDAYLKPFIEARQERLKPFAEAKNAILKSLKENGHALVNFTGTEKMNAGDGFDLVMNTAKEAGLTPFVFDFAASDAPTFYPIPPRPSVEKTPQEQYDFQYNHAITRMKESKANVMILDMDSKSDISAYTDAARDLNVQLVLAVTNFADNYDLKAQVSQDREQLVSIFEKAKPVLSKNSFLDRVKNINASTTDTPSVKIGKHI